jgi:ABC-type branched-subunit amino acid transport system substrate-binding protein
MKRGRWLALVLAFGLVAAACGDDDGGGDEAAPETTEAVAETTTTAGEDDFLDDGGEADGEADGAEGEDPCEGATLEATDTGVTEETITVLVMADVGSELAPGLFQGSIDGVLAWAEKVNAEGGLACRQVEVIEWDSALNPTETTNGFLEACDNAVAMVGSTSLFVNDISAIEGCGVADIPERAVSAGHSCSPNVFSVGGSNGLCPYSGEGPRDYVSMMGAYQWILDNELGGGPVNGIYLIPGDLPSTIASSMPTARGLNEIGVDTLGGEFGVSGRAEQATYGAYVQNMRDRGVTWAQTGSNDQSMIKLRKEAAAQGFDSSTVSWVCSLACYTPDFTEQGGADVEGTWVWMQFIPFEEADTNEELAKFLEYMGTDTPQSWSAGAWASGVLLEQVVNELVAEGGPNNVTSELILERLQATGEFDANGWYGTINLDEGGLSNCFALMQIQNGEYVRVFPEEPGTLDCSDDYLLSQPGLDAAAEYQG